MAPTRPSRKHIETSPDQLQLADIVIPVTEKALPMVPSTLMEMQRSQITKRKMGITSRQKQALIDNLQLESRCSASSTRRVARLTRLPVTERARRLRAGYNLQAQVLRSRIEVRLNRIPTALRKLTLGELLDKLTEQQRKPPTAPSYVRPPPVPEKDTPPRRQMPYKPGQVGYHYPTAAAQQRGHKRLR